MPRTITKTETLFTFDELSDSAKETAREWFREVSAQDFSNQVDFDDFERVAEILGINITDTYFTGFSSQGDGACFEGLYSYAPGSAKAIRGYAPGDTTLHHIADELQAVQRRYFYKLTASCSHRGHYCHSGCMLVNVDLDDSNASVRDTDEDEIIDAMRSLADWLYAQLEAEYWYMQSDEYIDDNITINEYEFCEDGSIA